MWLNSYSNMVSYRGNMSHFGTPVIHITFLDFDLHFKLLEELH